MNRPPLVSIVLPTYNGEVYIEQAILSCLKQKYSNFELIIVNDASTDGTISIIEKYIQRDKRIRCITHKKNLKLPAALNTGFSNAKGKYYTWISDDNMFKENALSIMVSALEENSNIDIVYANYDIIDERNKFIKKRIVSMPQYITEKNCIGACFMYRKEVHNKINGFKENMFLVEDYDFWLRASQYFQFHKLDYNLYFYRAHNKSLSYKKKKKIQRKLVKTLQEYLQNNKDIPYFVKSQIYLRIYSIKKKSFEQADTYLIKAILASPISSFLHLMILNNIVAKFAKKILKAIFPDYPISN